MMEQRAQEVLRAINSEASDLPDQDRFQLGTGWLSGEWGRYLRKSTWLSCIVFFRRCAHLSSVTLL